MGVGEFSIYKAYEESDEKFLKLFGSVTQGQIQVGDNMLLGPSKKGEFKMVTINDIKHLELNTD